MLKRNNHQVFFPQLEALSELEQRQLSSLRDCLRNLKVICIAYSGGVDSSLVAAIAYEQLGNNAFAVTGVSPSLAPNLLKEARQQASWIGIRHREIKTKELEDPNYSNNPKNRCFACKQELHLKIKLITKLSKNSTVVDGVNSDDLKEFRPGIEAARNSNVFSPLAELQINKKSIRSISHAIGLPWWDKPAQPCLASRFPYGESITAKRLKKVGKAEAFLRLHGLREVRVRSQGLAARIEIPEDKINTFLQSGVRKKIVDHFISIGFNSVSLDLEGLISGKLNRDNKKSN